MKHSLLFLLLPLSVAFAQSDTMLSKEDQTMPWHSSVYLALGYGYPQGFRGELGFHLSHFVGFSVVYSSGNYLSFFPHDNELGVCGEITIPLYSKITPYLRGGTGFGGSPYSQLQNTYYSLSSGALISLTPVFQLRID
ncbi:MAG TPA: hypothetical protein VFA55_10435, partial [Candidatus Kapabacteria bacterium]|nr:hypothetical protein [Candidatus Kapabacteria bacterium]